MSTSEPLGIICGKGLLPSLIAEGARQAGVRVVGLGLRGTFDADFPGRCDEFVAAAPFRMGEHLRKLRRRGVTRAVMVGKVEKTSMYHPWRLFRQLPDLKTIRWWFGLDAADRRTNRLLASLAEAYGQGGIQITDSTEYITDHLAGPGPMTRHAPTASRQRDIDFGLPLVDHLTALDIGQCIAVREGDVIAVEAIEGTDAMIERAGRLCRIGDWTLIKLARPDQDARFDVPVVGESTIRQMHRWGGRCLAVEAGKVIMLNKPAVIALANELGVTVVGVRRGDG